MRRAEPRRYPESCRPIGARSGRAGRQRRRTVRGSCCARPRRDHRQRRRYHTAPVASTDEHLHQQRKSRRYRRRAPIKGSAIASISASSILVLIWILSALRILAAHRRRLFRTAADVFDALRRELVGGAHTLPFCGEVRRAPTQVALRRSGKRNAAIERKTALRCALQYAPLYLRGRARRDSCLRYRKNGNR